MKKLLVILGILIVGTSLTVPFLVAEEPKEPAYKPFECPKTHISKQEKCMECHVTPSFKVKESLPCEAFQFPNTRTSITSNGSQKIGRFFLDDIADKQFRDALNYFYHHGIKRIIVEIHSPGGSLFDAWRIKGMVDEATANGILVETRIYGLAASAGFLIFCSGAERVATPTAEGMWHELITGEFIAIKTPADKEDEAKILRHLQDVANNFIASKSKVPKETLDAKIRKKEFWISGQEAFEMGFATRLIGGK